MARPSADDNALAALSELLHEFGHVMHVGDLADHMHGEERLERFLQPAHVRLVERFELARRSVQPRGHGCEQLVVPDAPAEPLADDLGDRAGVDARFAEIAIVKAGPAWLASWRGC